jgi:hypothetical protein
MSCEQRERYGNGWMKKPLHKLERTKENWYVNNMLKDKERELKERKYKPQWGDEVCGIPSVVRSICAPYSTKLMRDIEGIYLLYEGMVNSKTHYAMMCVFTLWLRDSIPGSLVEGILEYAKSVMDEAVQLAPHAKLEGSITAEPFWIEQLRKASADWKTFCSNPVFGHLSRFLGLIVSVGICKSETLTFDIGTFRLMEPQLYAIHSDAKDMVTALLDSAAFFAETLYKCYVDRSFRPLLTSKTEMDTLDENYLHLKTLWDYARNGNLYKFKDMEDTEFAFLLNKTLDGYKNVAKSLFKLERRIVDSKIYDLSQMQRDFILHKKGAGLRRRPFAFEVVGESAAGKSTFLSQLMDILLASQDLDLDLSRRYSKTSNDQYLSGWMTSHLTLTMDDFGNELTDAQGQPSDIGRMVIDVVNNQVYIPNMAELEQKGSLFVEPEIFAITTNVKDLHAQKLSACPVSIQGRMNYILNIAPVDKFRRISDEGVAIGIDYAKVQESLRTDPPLTPFDDRVWKVTIQEVVIEDADGGVKQLGKYKTVKNDAGKLMENIGFIEAANFMVEKFDAHRTKQKEIVASANMCRTNLSKCGIDGCTQLKGVCMQHYSPVRQHHLKTICNDSPIKIANDGLVGRNDKPERKVLSHFKSRGQKDKMRPHFGTERIYVDMKTALETIVRETSVSLLQRYTHVPQIIVKALQYLVRKWFNCVADDALFYLLPSFLLRTSIMKKFVFSSRVRTLMHATLLKIVLVLFMVVTWKFAQEERWVYILYCVLFSFAVVVVCLLYLYVTTEAYIGRKVARMNVRVSSIVGERRTREFQFCLRAMPILFVLSQIVRVMFFSKREQGSLEPKCVRDICQRDQEKTIWTDVSVRSLPYSSINSSTTIDNLSKIVRKNLLYVTIIIDDKRWMSNALMLSTNIMMIPEHYVTTDEFDIEAYKDRPHQAGGSFKAKLSTSLSYKLPGCDMRIFYVASGGSFKNILNHFPENLVGQVPFKMFWREKAGDIMEWSGRLSAVKKITTVSTFDGCEYKYLSGDTFAGLCGAPLLADTGRTCIVGVHLGGRQGTPIGVCGSFYRKQLQDAIDAINANRRICIGASCGSLPKACFGTDVDIDEVDPHKKSPVRFLPHGSQIAYHGSYPGRETSKSRVIDTEISPLVAYVCGSPNIYNPPKMLPEWYGYQKALENMSHVGSMFSPKLLEKAVDCYKMPLLRLVMPGGMFHGMRPLTYEENLNGVPGKRFIDAMKFDTSIGFPCTGPKSKYLEEDTPGARKFISEVNEDIVHMENCYRKGVRAYPIIKACKKDEVLAKKDKCRIFWSNPVHLTYMVRKYFLPLCRLLQMNPLTAECAVGINAISDEWHQLDDFVTSHGKERIIAGDYSKYDQKMPSQMILAAFSILIDLARESGYSEEDLRIMKNLTADVVFPVVAMNGDYISFTQGSHISGNSLTVVINGIVGALQWRMAFYELYPRANFRKEVALITYGDDNIGSVSPEYTDFNIVSIHEFLKRHGQVYTMPDKDSELVPFIPYDDVVFLQRRTRILPCGVKIGALVESSIFKRLHCIVYKPGNGLSKREMCAMNIDTSLLDWFFNGKEIYETRRMQMKEVAELADISHMCTNLDKTYEDWNVWWETNYLPKPDNKLKSIKLAPFDLWGPRGLLKDRLCAWIPFFSHQESQWGIEEASHMRDSERRLVFTKDARSKCDQAPDDDDESVCKYLVSKIQENNKMNTVSPVDSGTYTPHSGCDGSFCGNTFIEGVRYDVNKIQMVATNMTANMLATSYLKGSERSEICKLIEIGEDAFDLVMRRMENIESEYTNCTFTFDGDSDRTVRLHPQSGQETNDNKGSNVEYPENVEFTDADGGFATIINGIMDNSRYVRDDTSTAFKDDLHRVRRVETITWEIGNGSQGQFIPVWENLFNDEFIYNRLTGHKLFRGTLCIKATVNGNAMYHGLGQLCYRYFPNNLDDSGPTPTIGRGRSCIISQLPRILVNPTTSTGGTMKIPFHFHKDYLDLTTDDYKNLGELEFDVLAKLEHAQGSTVNIPIQVYAWFEDTFVSGLTESAVPPQSGVEDEQDEANKTGMLKHVPTALGLIGRSIKNVPMLDGLIRATAKGARMYSNGAALMGYSRPAMTEEACRYVLTPAGQLASTTVPSSVEKLSVDDKQELTISPTIAGASPDDPYDILGIASRDSYVFTADWSGSDLVGTRLVQAKVNPMYIVRRDDDPTGMAFSALAAAAFPFDYWTGSINFRFKVAASGLHKGRIRVVYDPTGLVAGAVDDQLARTVVKVVDIAEEPDFVVSVKNQQARGWLRCCSEQTFIAKSWGDDMITPNAFAVAPLSDVDNGTLAVYVENTLTAVNASTVPDVQIVIHVSAGDDFEVASPNNQLSEICPYLPNSQIPAILPQSGMENDKGAAVNHYASDEPDRKDVTYHVGSLVNIPDKNLVYMGESIKSFRPLLKRFTFTHSRVLPGESGVSAFTYTLPAFGIMPGEHDFGRGVSASDPNVLYAYSNLTMYQYMNLMHAGFRGGVRWKIGMVSHETSPQLIHVSRGSAGLGNVIDLVNFFDFNSRPLDIDDAFASSNSPISSMHSGGAVTNENNGFINVEVPFQHYHRFEPGKRYIYEVTKTGDSYLTVFAISRCLVNGSGSNLFFYSAAAEDYTNMFFTGLPFMRLKDAVA